MSSQDSISPPATRQNDSRYAAENPDQAGSNAHGRKKRVRNWTANDRAAHRVFERSRREAFKGRLTTLANLIPALQATDTNRLSKHVVLDESISLHKVEQQRLQALMQQVEFLVEEREELLTEVNRWRAGSGLGAREGRALEPLPEPNTSPAEHTSIDQALHDTEDLTASMHSAPLQHPEGTNSLPPFESMPPQIPINPPGVVGHTGVTPPNWEVMGMDMSTHGMGTSMGFNDMFSSNMVAYPPVVKPPGDMGEAPYMPDEPHFPQQPINILNPRYAGDPQIYGQ
ncbi:hypothetical protein CC79DRAFT_1372362 [Sarocladium strictum]